jgi:hypothetical protein
MPREATQDAGRVAALMTRRWLESTTWLDLPWNAYKHEGMCLVDCLDGSHKGFDLAGFFLDDKMPVYVENKGVSASGDQYQEYRKFLAIAYSSTVQRIESHKVDPQRTFMWVTSHPFAYSADWLTLADHDSMRKALEEFPELLAGREMDEELLRTVASRIWILVWNQKQKRILLKPDEIVRVQAFLGRKEDD